MTKQEFLERIAQLCEELELNNPEKYLNRVGCYITLPSDDNKTREQYQFNGESMMQDESNWIEERSSI